MRLGILADIHEDAPRLSLALRLFDRVVYWWPSLPFATATALFWTPADGS